MMTRFATLAAALAVLTGSPDGARAQVVTEKENVVSSRLEGEWVVDEPVTSRLGGRSRVEEAGEAPVLAFRGDAGVAERLLARHADVLRELTIYQAGVMLLGGREYPFLVSEVNGNPHVLYFRPRGEDAIADGESFIVMLAVAADRRNDLLLIGGDFNNQPFSAYRRR